MGITKKQREINQQLKVKLFHEIGKELEKEVKVSESGNHYILLRKNTAVSAFATSLFYSKKKVQANQQNYYSELNYKKNNAAILVLTTENKLLIKYNTKYYKEVINIKIYATHYCFCIKFKTKLNELELVINMMFDNVYDYRSYNVSNRLTKLENNIKKLLVIGKKYEWIYSIPDESLKHSMLNSRFIKEHSSLKELKNTLGLEGLSIEMFDNLAIKYSGVSFLKQFDHFHSGTLTEFLDFCTIFKDSKIYNTIVKDTLDDESHKSKMLAKDTIRILRQSLTPRQLGFTLTSEQVNTIIQHIRNGNMNTLKTVHDNLASVGNKLGSNVFIPNTKTLDIEIKSELLTLKAQTESSNFYGFSYEGKHYEFTILNSPHKLTEAGKYQSTCLSSYHQVLKPSNNELILSCKVVDSEFEPINTDIDFKDTFQLHIRLRSVEHSLNGYMFRPGCKRYANILQFRGKYNKEADASMYQAFSHILNQCDIYHNDTYYVDNPMGYSNRVNIQNILNLIITNN